MGGIYAAPTSILAETNALREHGALEKARALAQSRATTDRRRLKIARLLTDFGRRVEKNVFECHLDQRRFLDLKQKLHRLLHHEEDSVRSCPLCPRCRRAMEVSGWGAPLEEDEELIIV